MDDKQIGEENDPGPGFFGAPAPKAPSGFIRPNSTDNGSGAEAVIHAKLLSME